MKIVANSGQPQMEIEQDIKHQGMLKKNTDRLILMAV